MPDKCPFCDHNCVEERPMEHVAGVIAEAQAWCSHCGCEVGYWAYGYWDPSQPYPVNNEDQTHDR